MIDATCTSALDLRLVKPPGDARNIICVVLFQKFYFGDPRTHPQHSGTTRRPARTTVEAGELTKSVNSHENLTQLKFLC